MHPIEFVCGEYLHLAVIYLVPCHASAAIAFILAGGVFASLNHTRYDLSFISSAVYNVKNHDVHHRLPESNYGQYIVLWDWLMGSYRPYTEKGEGAEGSDDDDSHKPIASRFTRSSAKKTKTA